MSKVKPKSGRHSVKVKRNEDIDARMDRNTEENTHQYLDDNERARKRTDEIRGAGKMDTQDQFHIPLEVIPEGWTYFWIRHSYAGGIPDNNRRAEVTRLGMRLVPSARHPELFGDLDTDYVERGGQCLYELPNEIVKDMQAELRKKNLQVRNSLVGVSPMAAERRPVLISAYHGDTHNPYNQSRSIQFGD